MKREIIILTLDEQQSICGGAFGGGDGGRFRQEQGQGRGRGQGQGQGREGHDQGQGLGMGGFCVCPECNEKVLHQRNVPCYSTNCTACDVPMLREAK